jgi:hypothetical protein
MTSGPNSTNRRISSGYSKFPEGRGGAWHAYFTLLSERIGYDGQQAVNWENMPRFVQGLFAVLDHNTATAKILTGSLELVVHHAVDAVVPRALHAHSHSRLFGIFLGGGERAGGTRSIRDALLDLNVCGCFMWDALCTGLASVAAAAALPPVDPLRLIHKGKQTERRVKSKLDERQSDGGR